MEQKTNSSTLSIEIVVYAILLSLLLVFFIQLTGKIELTTRDSFELSITGVVYYVDFTLDNFLIDNQIYSRSFYRNLPTNGELISATIKATFEAWDWVLLFTLIILLVVYIVKKSKTHTIDNTSNHSIEMANINSDNHKPINKTAEMNENPLSKSDQNKIHEVVENLNDDNIGTLLEIIATATENNENNIELSEEQRKSVLSLLKTVNKKRIVKEKIDKTFDESVENIIQNELTNDPLTDGILVQANIVSLYQSLKEDKTLMIYADFSEKEYEQMLNDILKEKMQKYLK